MANHNAAFEGKGCQGLPRLKALVPALCVRPYSLSHCVVATFFESCVGITKCCDNF